jgi:tRNA nucleotidyltransferase/poly(A) polymerase
VTPARVIGRRIVGAAFLDDPKVARMFDVFDGGGEETRIVGGAIRNALIGVRVHEVDFATTAEPDEILRRAREAHLRALPTGIAHGTATILVDGTPFELTSLRVDVETDGRRAKVRFGRSFAEDALRRDFTMNALFAARDGTLFDSVGGLADIERRRVRFIGEARRRIAEDYLRILRFFRFHADFGEGAMDPEAFSAIVAEREGLARLSRERVRAELLKLLVARRAAPVVADVAAAGIFGAILGGAPNPARMARLIGIEDCLSGKPAMSADALLRLAALAVQTREDAERLFDLLRLSNAEQQRLAKAADALAPLHGLETQPGAKRLRVLVYRHGAEAARDALILAGAESRAAARDVAAWVAALAALETPRFPFTAADLMARGLAPGPAIGVALKRLEDEWIANDFAMDDEAREKRLAVIASGAKQSSSR